MSSLGGQLLRVQLTNARAQIIPGGASPIDPRSNHHVQYLYLQPVPAEAGIPVDELAVHNAATLLR